MKQSRIMDKENSTGLWWKISLLLGSCCILPGIFIESLRDMFGLMMITFYVIALMPTVKTYFTGYRLYDDRMEVRAGLSKKYIMYSDIKYLVISFAASDANYKILDRWLFDGKQLKCVLLPGISILTEDSEKLHKKVDGILTNSAMSRFLGKSKVLYSFAWNSNFAKKVISKFNGRLFITNSINVTYGSWVNEMLQKYSVSEKNLVIVQDNELGEISRYIDKREAFIWENIDHKF